MRREMKALLLAGAGLFVGSGCGTLEEQASPSSPLAQGAATGTCGDAIRTADEQCDDGNTANGDGCSSLCAVEAGYLCTNANFSLAYEEHWSLSGAYDPEWILSPDGLSVEQTKNSDPGIYMTNLPAVGTTLTFDLTVRTTEDDDYIGWVVAYDQGDLTNPQAEFMLFDWKQATQAQSGYVGRVGMAMSRVRGVVKPVGTDKLEPFWAHKGAISEEARALTLGSKGWTSFASHRVKMKYELSRIQVWVDGVLQFDQPGTFPAGRFGFYTSSQQASLFKLVSPTTGSICGLDPQADPDGDGVPTASDPKPFDPSVCGDANGDGVDDCAVPPQECIRVRLGDYNLFLTGDYSLGRDVQGKVAAGGTISLTDFSVGWKLPASQTDRVLVAGGDLNLTRGGLWGDAWHGGKYTPRDSVTFYRGHAAQGTPLDFTARGAELRKLSLQLAALAANATTTLESWGGITLRGTRPDVNVFDVPASAFTGARLLSITAPAGSLALINIRGNAATFSNFGHSFNGGIDQHGVLFHFVDAESITAKSYGFWGTVLAPKAHVTFNSGSFDGGIYARSLTGNAEGHLNALHDRDICP